MRDIPVKFYSSWGCLGCPVPFSLSWWAVFYLNLNVPLQVVFWGLESGLCLARRGPGVM